MALIKENEFSRIFQDNDNQISIFDAIDQKVTELINDGIDVLDLGVGDPGKTLGVPKFIISKANHALKASQYDGYPGNKGDFAFRKAAADYLQHDFSINIDPKTEINITNGSKTAVSIFPKILVDPGDIVICPCPGYPGFHEGTYLASGVPYFAPLCETNNFLIDFKSIPLEIVKKTKIIWINYPNSPTGKMAPKSWLEELITWAHHHNIVIASDEAYADIYYNKKPFSPLHFTKNNVISFYSMSKRNNMTNYRIGFAAGDPKIIAAFYKLKNMHDDGVPQFIQQAAIAGLENYVYAEKMRIAYKTKKDLLVNAMQTIGCPKPTSADGSIFLWQKTPGNLTGLDFAKKLLELGVIVIPGKVFTKHANLRDDPAKNYIRISLSPTLATIKKAVQQIYKLKL